jgi:hypothetical protein
LTVYVRPPAVPFASGVTLTVHTVLAPGAMTGVVYPAPVTAAVWSVLLASRYCTANDDDEPVP